jgi:hypothetical protein
LSKHSATYTIIAAFSISLSPFDLIRTQMPSLIYDIDSMDAIKLVDEVFACLNSLLEMRIGQGSSLLSYQSMRRRHGILNLEAVSGKPAEYGRADILADH